MFLDLWQDETGERPVLRSAETQALPGGMTVQVLTSHTLGEQSVIASQYRQATNQARRRIWITNPYFLPSAAFRRALRKAAKRGVDVRLLLPGTCDHPHVQYATQHFYGRYIHWGIRVLQWNGPMVHVKTAVIDGVWSMVGSFNLDRLSLVHNHEITAVILNHGFGARMESTYEEDGTCCREVTHEEWRNRGIRQRLMGRFWSAFRVWM